MSQAADASTACGLAASDLATAKSYRPIKDRSRTRSLDSRRIESHRKNRRRTDGCLRQLRRCAADYRIRRRAVELVRPPQPRSVLERRQTRPRQARCLLDVVRMLADHRENHRPVCAVFSGGDVAKFGRRRGSERGRSQGSRGVQSSSAFRLPPSAFESVHLTDFPTGDAAAIDEQLSLQMKLVREIASLGLAARMGAKLKVRQPLGKVEVILADRGQQAFLEGHVELLKKELNVKQVEFTRACRSLHHLHRAARFETAWPAAWVRNCRW